MRAIRPSAGFLAILVVPFTFNVLLHRGFYNFCFSLPVFFLVVGYWLKHRERFGARQALALATLLVLLYFCHLVSVVMAGVALAVLGAWWTAAEALRPGAKPLWPGFRSRVLPFAAFAPALLLAAGFLGRQGAGSANRNPPAELWEQLRSLSVLFSYRPAEALVAAPLAWFFAGLTLLLLLTKVVRRRFGACDGLLLVVAAFVAVYFAAPEGVSGGTFLNLRLQAFPFFALALWFAAQPSGAALRNAVRVAGSAAAVALAASHAAAYAELNDYLDEYLAAAPLVEPNATVLPLCFSQQGQAPDGRVLALRVCPFLHAGSYLTPMKQIGNLDNYEAEAGYFPTLFRPGVSPYQNIGTDRSRPDGGLHEQPPRADFLGYPERSGREVDYVLLWGVRPEQREVADTKEIFRQLGQGYRRVFTSGRRGMTQLYRRSGGEGVSGGQR